MMFVWGGTINRDQSCTHDVAWSLREVPKTSRRKEFDNLNSPENDPSTGNTLSNSIKREACMTDSISLNCCAVGKIPALESPVLVLPVRARSKSCSCAKGKSVGQTSMKYLSLRDVRVNGQPSANRGCGRARFVFFALELVETRRDFRDGHAFCDKYDIRERAAFALTEDVLLMDSDTVRRA